jgi:hypothetical protein
MTFNPRLRTFAVSLILGIPVCLAAAAQPGTQPRQGHLPFRCSAEEWKKTFEVGAPTYNPATGKLTWVLEAKKAMRLGRYEAYVTDANAVESGVREVTFTPKLAEYKAKAKVTATVSLGDIDVDDVCRVVIRPKEE